MREPFGAVVELLKPIWGFLLVGVLFATPVLWIVAMRMRHSEEYWRTEEDMTRELRRARTEAHADEFAKAKASATNDREFIRCVLWCVDNSTISVSPEQENRDEQACR